MILMGRGALVALVLAISPLSLGLAQTAPTGTYKVDGKAGPLTQVKAYKGAPEAGKPITVLVFTGKDQGKSANAASDALFGELGDAVVVKVFDDGKIYNAELVHTAFNLPNNTLTLFNGVTIKDFKRSGGEISGDLTSEGGKDARGQTWEIDLVFTTKAP